MSFFFLSVSYPEQSEIEAQWKLDPAKRHNDKLSDIIRLTPEEETWLRSHKTIRVGMSPVIPPLKFSEKGIIKGIEPDYLTLLSKCTGIQFEYVICDFPVMDAKVKSGEMDMFLSFYIPERLAYMTFTEPLMEFKQVIIARADAPFMSGIGALKGKKVATVKGVKLYEKQLSPYPDIEVVPVGSSEETFKAVSEFKADALISRTYIAGYVMQNYPNLKIAGIADFPPEPYLYAVRKDYPELVDILNKAITSITRDRREAIAQKWFSVRIEYRPNWSEIQKWAFAIGGAFTLLLGLSFFWNRRLSREIDKRTQTEEALRESEEKFRAMAETIPLAIYLSIGIEQKCEYLNPMFIKLFGYTLDIIPTVEQWWPLAYPDEEYRRQISEEWTRRIERAIETQSPIEPMEVVVTCKDGSKKNISWGYITLGEKNYAYGLDMTELKRAEEERKLFIEELERSNMDLQQFAYVASHDMQEPLRMISSYLQLIERRYQDKLDSDAKDFIHYAVDGANRLRSLIDGLLEFSRIKTQGNLFTRVDVSAVLDSVCRNLDTLIIESGAMVRYGQMPMIQADEAQIARLFQNLIQNALKFRREGTPPLIEITAEKTDNRQVFRVRDNGVGIESPYFERIFIIFQRLHTREQYPGTGIGLSICKRIVERHRGIIWVESTLDEGSSFCFSIPEGIQ